MIRLFSGSNTTDSTNPFVFPAGLLTSLTNDLFAEHKSYNIRLMYYMYTHLTKLVFIVYTYVFT